jgi:hypothetical protein
VASNGTAEGRNANRRVTLVILSSEPGAPGDPAAMPNGESVAANGTDPAR